MRAPLLVATALLLAGCAGPGEAQEPEETRAPEVAAAAAIEEAPAIENPPEPEPPAAEAAPPLLESSLPSDAVDRKVLLFREYLQTKPDTSGLLVQIEELGLAMDPRVAGALKPLLRSRDDPVVIAVARCIGRQGDPKVARDLRGLADTKGMDGRPEVLAALIGGIADADPEGNHDWFLKTAKKYLDRNAVIAAAALRATSLGTDRDTMDDLIRLLERADYLTEHDSPAKRASRKACRQVLLDLLQGITGLLSDDVKVWREWWSQEKKNWKEPVTGGKEDEALDASDVVADACLRFTVRRPNRAWLFRRSDALMNTVILEAFDEGRRAAWVEVSATPTKNYVSKTPAAWAAEMRPGLEGKFREIKEADWVRVSAEGGAGALDQIAWGMHKDYDAVLMRARYQERNGVMLQAIGFWKAGAAASLKDDLETIIAGIRFTE